MLAKRVLVSTPAKVSLFGEYSKIVGESITVSVTNLQTDCLASISEKGYFEFYSDRYKQKKIVKDITKLGGGSWANYVSASVQSLKHFGYKIPYLMIDISSNISFGEGLSSSSSLIVSVIYAISTELNLNLTRKDVAEFAYYAESKLMNILCGRMDHYSCSIGGIQYIDHFANPVRLITDYSLPEDTSIVIAETGLKKNTSDIISSLTTKYKNGDSKIIKHIEIERKLIKNTLKLLNKNSKDLASLGLLLNQAHQSYRENLNSSFNIHDLLCEAAKKSGAFGAKITGGGFGGSVFALTNKQGQNNVCESMSKISKKVHICSISNGGVKRVDKK